MQMTEVKSSNISAIGFTKEHRITLNSPPTSVMRVTFTHGESYDYYGVPEKIYREFVKAESIGKYFHEHVNKKYTFEKVKE